MDEAATTDVRIREATVADAEMVAVAHVAAWRAGYAGQLPEEFLAGLSVESRTSLAWRRVFAGAGDSAAADPRGRGGRRRSRVRLRGAEPCVGAPAGTGELWGLYTHPDAWRQGIGTALHSAAMGALADAGFARATLWVLTTNARARSFYEGRGCGPTAHPDGLAG